MYLKCNGTVCKMKNWQLMLQIHLLDTPHVFIMVNELIVLPNKKHEYLQTIHAPKLLVENYTCNVYVDTLYVDTLHIKYISKTFSLSKYVLNKKTICIFGALFLTSYNCANCKEDKICWHHHCRIKKLHGFIQISVKIKKC